MPKKSSKFKEWMVYCRYFISLFGFCLGIFGVLCGMYWEDTFRYILAKELILRPHSTVYDNWKSPPLELSLDIYLFNWTNPEDIRDTSTKPNMVQLGPYRFTERPDKVDIVWHDHNNSVTYRRKSDFFFDAEGSNGSLSDVIVTLNAVALSAAGKAKSWNTGRQNMVNVGLNLYGQELSIVKTADELLFTGYSDSMIDIARAMPIFGKDVEVPFDKFGWFYTRNGSADLTGVFNVFTGADDISKLGQMHTWNYKKHAGYFDSYCGMINGSAGEFQSPNLQPNGFVELFTPDMCRAIPLDYVETVDIEGLKGYKYAGGPRSVDNGSIYEENLCYCGGECVPSGVMNISSCRYGSPVFMSYPHFYNADPYYVSQVEGLSPNREDHEFYMILEPNTGVALEVAARFQVNMMLEPIGDISLLEDVPRTFLPLIWFEQKVRIPSDMLGELKMVPLMLIWGQIFAGVCVGIGLIMLCWYPVTQLWARCSNSQAFKPTHKSPYATNHTEPQILQLHNSNLDKNHVYKTPDSSPLLQKSHVRYPKIALLPQADTFDSVKTNDTTVSVRTQE